MKTITVAMRRGGLAGGGIFLEALVLKYLHGRDTIPTSELAVIGATWITCSLAIQGLIYCIGGHKR